MKPVLRVLLCGLAAALLSPSPAGAEKTIAVNATAGVFDQPAVVMSGATARVAYIGGDNTAGPFRVYYAAVNGGANFASLTLQRDNTVILAGPVAVDNAAPGNDTYADARHPKIALRSATEAVILFQAAPTPGASHEIYVARLTLSGNAVTAISVKRVAGMTAGHSEDLSFALVTADNTARVAFANRPSATPGTSRVWFARVAVDTASVVGSPIPLSDNTATGSDGFRPVPSLRVDAATRAHVAWAANGATPAPAAVFYAMLNGSGALDNVAIGATEVLGRTLAWGHPNVVAAATNVIYVIAGDESAPGFAGSVGLVRLNPDADDKDGSPAQVGTIRSFLVRGPDVLPTDFDLFRPEVVFDPFGRFHLTGYGAQGSSATYYLFTLIDTYPFAQFTTKPAPVGLNEFPGEIPGDYTKASLGYLSGRAVVFWSGTVPGTENRNLNVTGVPTAADVPPPHEESGCAMVRDPSTGSRGRMAEGVLLIVPALLLAARRRLRRPSRGTRAGIRLGR